MPAKSRDGNRKCMLFDFFDSHDVWHFLSAMSMFFGFMVSLWVHLCSVCNLIPLYLCPVSAVRNGQARKRIRKHLIWLLYKALICPDFDCMMCAIE